jgi:hypothetical protein
MKRSSGHGSRRKSEIFVGQKAHAFFELAETTRYKHEIQKSHACVYKGFFWIARGSRARDVR